MKKIVFAIALLATLGVVSYASVSLGGPNYKDQSVKPHKHVHHAHIVVPCDHYSI